MNNKLVLVFNIIFCITAIRSLEVDDVISDVEQPKLEHEKDPKLCKINDIFPL